MRDRLIELLNEVGKNILQFPTDNFTTSLADYLIENGVVILPCKVGDIIYQTDTDKTRLYESKITKIIYDTNGIAFDERAIGKSVFLTKEEAEKALKGGVQE